MTTDFNSNLNSYFCSANWEYTVAEIQSAYYGAGLDLLGRITGGGTVKELTYDELEGFKSQIEEALDNIDPFLSSHTKETMEEAEATLRHEIELRRWEDNQ